jgi:hypothetical protein
MRTLIATVLSLMLGTAAMAADPQNLELTVKILNVKVEKFDRTLQTRKGRYAQALVLRLEVERRAWESLPPSVETFLYIGSHELRPFATELEADRVILTFHDPDWQELKGGEPMVLTTQHGDPVRNPQSYAGYPRYDPKTIDQK